MSENELVKVRAVLDNYLATNQHRKTPERYAILDAVYSIGGHFTMEELNDELEKKHFHVSKATLYNTIRLFLELRIIVRHNLTDGTKYEARFDNENHVHQVCTVCGKVTEIQMPSVNNAISKAKSGNFRRDGFALYIYGVCLECQARPEGMTQEEKAKGMTQEASKGMPQEEEKITTGRDAQEHARPQQRYKQHEHR